MGGADLWLGWSCCVQAESWGKKGENGQGLKPGVENPHLMIILVPHSDFCGCLCLEVCLHLGKTEYYSLWLRGQPPTSETQMPDPLTLSLGYSAINILLI